jgi:large subunit ribosomal protein L23
MAELRNILIRPLFTEKSSSDDMREANTYVFQVGLDANKPQIKKAVEQYFNVEVDAVRTLVVRGKSKRFGRRVGKRSNWKKAYIKLADGHQLDLYEEE